MAYTLERFKTEIQPLYEGLSDLNSGYLTQKQAENFTFELISLLADQDVEPDLLRYLAAFFTPDVYMDTIDEREIQHKCGYFSCSKATERKSNWHPRDSNKVSVPFGYLNGFCSKAHYQNTKFYLAQLSDNVLFQRKDVFANTAKVILLEDVWDRSESNDSSLIDILNDLNLGEDKKTEEKQGETSLMDIDEIVTKEVVEKNPERVDQQQEESGETLSAEEKSKMIEGYLSSLDLNKR